MSNPKIRMVIKDWLRRGFVVNDTTTTDQAELVYDFMLYDRDKHMHFIDQVAALLRGRPGFSLIELDPVNNTHWKFGEPIQEKFEFEVTLTWLEE